MLCADDVKSIHRVTLLFRDALDPTISRCSPGAVIYTASQASHLQRFESGSLVLCIIFALYMQQLYLRIIRVVV